MRRHQQTRVEHGGTEYRITVDSDHVRVQGVKHHQRGDGGTVDLFWRPTDEERAEVLLAHPDLSQARSYHRAISHARRRQRFT